MLLSSFLDHSSSERLAVGLGHHEDNEDGVGCADGGKVEEKPPGAPQGNDGRCHLHLVIVLVIVLLMVLVIVLVMVRMMKIIIWTATKMLANWTDIRVPETTLFNSGENHSAEKKKDISASLGRI